MWLVTITERVHQMREQLAQAWTHPQWIIGVQLTPFTDYELLRLRGRYAKAMPGVEVH